MSNKDKPFSTPADTAGIQQGSGVPFNVGEIRLPDGTMLNLQDWVNGSLYSALVVDPWQSVKEWEPFTYGRMQPISGSNVPSSRAHTNVPRSGDSGLPKEWEMYVLQWRATVNAPLEQPVLDWAAETMVQFAYNDRYYGNTPLIDLLLGARPIGDPLPIRMRENLSYKVHVVSEERTTAALREWLRGGTTLPDSVREAATELAAIVRMQPDSPIAASLRHIQAKLQPGRRLTAWIHLEGPLKRVIF